MNLVYRIYRGLIRRSKYLLGGVPGTLRSIMHRGKKSHLIVYVSDKAGWVLDEVGYNIASRLPSPYQMWITDTYKGYRNLTIHFAAPPIYFKNEAYLEVNPSNTLLLTWTHGLPNNDDPNIQLQIERLKTGSAYLDRIKVQTTTARDFLISQGIEPAKIVHIPLGVNTKLFRPPSLSERTCIRKKLGVPADAICIGSFQKDSPGWDNRNHEPKWVKGPDILIKVLTRLADKYPIHVILTSPARGYVIEHLEQANIPYRHDVLDDISELPPYYHALDFYLITSRDEGGPMSLLEAMASGIPVVSTNIGIPKDAIVHGINGMLADIDDVEALTVFVRQLIDDTDLWRAVAQSGRQTALEYDWAIIANKYAHLLYNR